MKNILFSTLTLCVLALFTQSAFAQTAADEQAIKNAFTSAIDAYYAGDAAKATSIYTEKGVYVSHTGQIYSGKDAIHKAFEEEIKMQKPTPESFKFKVSNVRFLNANIALVLADVSGVAEVNGQKFEWAGVSSFTVSRNGSQWLVELEQDTPIMPENN